MLEEEFIVTTRIVLLICYPPALIRARGRLTRNVPEVAP